jgi:hypothetical protein
MNWRTEEKILALTLLAACVMMLVLPLNAKVRSPKDAASADTLNKPMVSTAAIDPTKNYYVPTTNQIAAMVAAQPPPVPTTPLGSYPAAIFITKSSNTVVLKWTATNSYESFIESKPTVVPSGATWLQASSVYPPTNSTNVLQLPRTNSMMVYRVVARPTNAPVPGTFRWVGIGVLNANASPTAVAADANGNVISSGAFAPYVDFGNTHLESAGGTDIFVVKYNSQGGLLWAKRLGGIYNEDVTGVATDSTGNIIVCGFFSGTVDFGGTPLTAVASTDTYVAKYSPGTSGVPGTLIWARRFGSSSSSGGKGVSLDGSGNVFVACQFVGTGMVFDSFTVANTGPGNAIAVAKLSSNNGTALWAKGFSSSSLILNSPSALAIDKFGDAVLCGGYNGTVNLCGQSVVSAGYDVFLVKFSGSDGLCKWFKPRGSPSDDGIKAVAADPITGNIIATGNYRASSSVGGPVVAYYDGTANNDGGLFLAAYDVSGNYLWARTPNIPGYGYGAGDLGVSVTVDSSGNIFYTGQLTSFVSFAPNTFLSGNATYFIASANSTGASRWVKRAGGAAPTSGSAIAVDSAGHVASVGGFRNTIYFDDLDHANGGSATTTALSAPFVVQHSK